jgi:hypothetical protein
MWDVVCCPLLVGTGYYIPGAGGWMLGTRHLFGSLGPKNEPQNIECRILNVEGWNRFAQSFL